jgi:hypothetical protein
VVAMAKSATTVVPVKVLAKLSVMMVMKSSSLAIVVVVAANSATLVQPVKVLGIETVLLPELSFEKVGTYARANRKELVYGSRTQTLD